VTFKAVDRSVPSITVTTEDGRVVTRKIEDETKTQGVKPGDKIDITFTRPVVIAMQNAK
jgi:hypothetical protein